MILTLTTTHHPATDLGYLLHKSPNRVHSFDLSFGKAHVFYPDATDERCTAVLVLDVDPVGLVRGKGHGEGRTLAQYVNDRPYVASSYLSVAMAQVYRNALGATSKERAELAGQAIPLEATLHVVSCYGGDALLRKLFEPLGYEVQTTNIPLDETFQEWGQSRYYSLTLRSKISVAELLTHLYVLIPTLDAAKHYFIGDEEVAKLLKRGGTWLKGHPEKGWIVRRFLKNRTSLVRQALDQLVPEEIEPTMDAPEVEEVVEKRVSLHSQRLGSVFAALKQSGARRVVDLGCGEGRLLELLLKDRQFSQILGMDVSYRSLEMAQDNLRFDRLPSMVRERISLIQGSLIYRDDRIKGFDAAAVVEVIEHLDPHRLSAFERALFEFARPATVVVTTPNSEYNVLFETLEPGKMRHRDHRFEWTRTQFSEWAEGVCERHGYEARYLSIGPEDPTNGAPSQMAIFTKSERDRSQEVSA